ncbi:MAG: hypothetical protein AAF346_17945, partial [Pseudomonadota bacterium]
MTSIALTDWRSQISTLLGVQVSDQLKAMRSLALGLTWLAVVSGAIAISEPAITDVLMIGLILLLPIAGLAALNQALILLLCVWMIAGASALIASSQADDFSRAVIHSSVSIYLYLAFFVLAAFIAKRPAAHTRLVLQAYVGAAILTSAIVILGYVGLVTGTDNQLGHFDYTGVALANPGLLGSFLVPPLLYTLHLMISRPLTDAIAPACVFVLMGFAILVGSRPDAGMNLAIAGTVYVFFAFTTSPIQLQRLKLILVAALGSVALASILVVSTQQPQTSQILAERAKAGQASEVEYTKRLDRYNRLVTTIPIKPIGIGALEFGEHYHSEQPGNVYLNMMLQSGWIGGLIFIAITILTVIVGFAHAIKPSRLQSMIIIAYSAFLGLAVQGLTSDLDHWRHYYLIMAILWGLIASN